MYEYPSIISKSMYENLYIYLKIVITGKLKEEKEMSFTTKLIIFMAGIAVLAGVASMIVEAAIYISTGAILAILIILAYKIYAFLFHGKANK